MRVLLLLSLLSTATAFHTAAFYSLRSQNNLVKDGLCPGLRAPRVIVRGGSTSLAALGGRVGFGERQTKTGKQSPLEGGGIRGIEEEERRISLWKARFELNDEQVNAMRDTFEQMISELPGSQRTVPLNLVKKAIERASTITDMADVHNNDQPEQGRPTISEDELKSYINMLNGLWAEVCDTDASEIANGECQVPLDNRDLDLSECVALFGICLREHCGVGGVCFWDSD